MKFENPDSWVGGFYELSIYLPKSSEIRVLELLNQIWSYPLLEGPYPSRDIPIQDQTIISPLKKLGEINHLHGLAQITPEKKIVVGTGQYQIVDTKDWYTFIYFPMNSLFEIFPESSGYPVRPGDGEYQNWQRELDAWFFDLAKYIYTQHQFTLAAIGFEVDASEAFEEYEHGEINNRYFSLVMPEDDGLRFIEQTDVERKEQKVPQSLWARIKMWFTGDG